MNISYNWLKDYIDTPLTPAQLADALTSIGLETGSVEEVESIRGGLRGIVVGKVLTCVEHPDSDHLHITTVDLGDGQPTQIVCGAANVAAGQTVVVATVGTTLYNGDKEFKIKKSKIRGVESFGMICAEDEIGVGTSHDGIMVLPDSVAAGTPAAEYFGLTSDYVLEVDLTPNRIDAASHFGVARDLAAWASQHAGPLALKRPSVDTFTVDREDGAVPVEVADAKACPRYSGITIRGIKVTESPDWLKNRLNAIGLRPINSVVDITNYILHTIGQPLHCFDLAKIDGEKIIVRRCPEGTPFTTLDGVEHKLSEADLMICSATKPMCIAGVFGGLDSGVTEATTDIFIESAYFNPTSVRKTARRHGLQTDASFRYERGTDPNITMYALKLAAILVKELAGGETCGQPVDLYPEPVAPFPVTLSYDYARGLIGKDIPADTIESILRALEIEIVKTDGREAELRVPTYRVDVQRPCDVVEDILRIYGYNNVEIPEHVNSTLSYAPNPDRNRLINIAADYLSANGYTEIMSNSLTKAAYYEGLESYKSENCVKIMNPLSADLNVMRQTLLFNTLEAVELNANRRNGDLRLYEFGNCYRYDLSHAGGEDALAPYTETYRLAMAVTGVATPLWWNSKAEQASFFTLRAMIERLLRRFGIDIYSLKCEPLQSDLFADAVSISANGKELLQMGVVSPALRRRFSLKTDVFFMEMNFDSLVKLTRKHKIAYTELSKFPEVRRDLALLVDRDVTFLKLRDIAFATEKKLLKSVSLFDVYEGDKLPAGKKSYALSFILEDKSRTLDEKTIERVMANLAAQFESRCGATVRS